MFGDVRERDELRTVTLRIGGRAVDGCDADGLGLRGKNLFALHDDRRERAPFARFAVRTDARVDRQTLGRHDDSARDVARLRVGQREIPPSVGRTCVALVDFDRDHVLAFDERAGGECPDRVLLAHVRARRECAVIGHADLVASDLHAVDVNDVAVVAVERRFERRHRLRAGRHLEGSAEVVGDDLRAGGAPADIAVQRRRERAVAAKAEAACAGAP